MEEGGGDCKRKAGVELRKLGESYRPASRQDERQIRAAADEGLAATPQHGLWTWCGRVPVGYALVGIPSNVLLARVGERVTLLRIMVLWGLACAATVFVTTAAQFYLVRFLVGVFEAEVLEWAGLEAPRTSIAIGALTLARTEHGTGAAKLVHSMNVRL